MADTPRLLIIDINIIWVATAPLSTSAKILCSLAHWKLLKCAMAHTINTRGLRSVIDLLLRTIDEPHVSVKGIRFVHDAHAFVGDPKAQKGSTFCSYADLYMEAATLALTLREQKNIKKRVVMCHVSHYYLELTLILILTNLALSRTHKRNISYSSGHVYWLVPYRAFCRSSHMTSNNV